MEVLTFELNADDRRDRAYQVKTIFHELFHAKSDGLPHDALQMGFREWAYFDDVFAEAFSHYAVKSLGITEEIAPSYAGHLVRTLPKLKKLPEFKDAKTIADFGEIAYGYRFGNSAKATWDDLKRKLDAIPFDLSSYSQSYRIYIENHAEELIDKMLENMPGFEHARAQMLAELRSALTRDFKGLYGNEKIVAENVLIIAMNRLGVNEA